MHNLTPTEQRLLKALDTGRLENKYLLADKSRMASPGCVRWHVVRLRRKLYGQAVIRTKEGYGYSLEWIENDTTT